MDTDATTTLLENVFQTWRETGDMSRWLAVLSHDVEWTIAGSRENSGLYKGKQNYIDNVLGNLNKWVKQPPVPTLQKLVVNGDWASAWLRADAEGLDGTHFVVDYCWLIRVHDREIVEVIGFYA